MLFKLICLSGLMLIVGGIIFGVSIFISESTTGIVSDVFEVISNISALIGIIGIAISFLVCCATLVIGLIYG